jgi:outer membrane protein
MRNFKASILAIFVFGSLAAQELNVLTKEAAIAETLQNNFGITIAENNLEIADNNRDLLNYRKCCR